MTAVLRMSDGEVMALDLDRWRAPAGEVDVAVLGRAVGPVIDVGCGPGRLVEALAARGIPALGIDASPTAVQEARAHGVPVLLRSVWDPLPGSGRWSTAILLDGNIGIGGDPPRLLRRVAELLCPGGRLLAEVEAGGGVTGTARLELDDVASAWFPWARVGADAVGELAARAGFAVSEEWSHGERFFTELRRR